MSSLIPTTFAGRAVNCSTDLSSCSGLVSYWEMDDSSGTVTDLMGLNNCTNAGSVTYGSTGVVDDALSFNENISTGYLSCGNNPSAQISSNITVEAWVKPAQNSDGDFDYIATKLVHSSSKEGYALGIWSDNKPMFIVGNSWSMWTYAISDTSLTAGNWYHIVGTFDDTANVVKIYVNGEEKGSQNYTGSITDSTTPFLIGKRSDGEPFNGIIDEVRLWNKALSPTEVTQAYNIGAQPVFPGTDFSGSGSTDFESVSNMSSISDLKLATTDGSITWSNSVNAHLQDVDSNVNIGTGYASVNSSNLNSSWNSQATLSFPVLSCSNYLIYYASGVYSNLDDIKDNGQECDAESSPACSNISCSDSTVTFTVAQFSSYGVDGAATVPEFPKIAYLLAVMTCLGVVVVTTKAKIFN